MYIKTTYIHTFSKFFGAMIQRATVSAVNCLVVLPPLLLQLLLCHTLQIKLID